MSVPQQDVEYIQGEEEWFYIARLEYILNMHREGNNDCFEHARRLLLYPRVHIIMRARLRLLLSFSPDHPEACVYNANEAVQMLDLDIRHAYPNFDTDRHLVVARNALKEAEDRLARVSLVENSTHKEQDVVCKTEPVEESWESIEGRIASAEQIKVEDDNGINADEFDEVQYWLLKSEEETASARRVGEHQSINATT